MEKIAYVNNANGAFIEDLYRLYQEDPEQLDAEWQGFFRGFDFAAKQTLNGQVAMTDKEVSVMKLINAYRGRGHLVASTNPVRQRRLHNADLDLAYFGLEESDLDTVFEVGSQCWIGPSTLRDIITHLQDVYCGSIGAEYRYIRDSDLRTWLHESMESPEHRQAFEPEQKRHILEKLTQGVGFEKFLHVKYTGQKRFSLEGCEAFIPALDILIEEGARLGAREFVMGMAHRGRLNVLVNIFQKSYENMLSEFGGSVLPDFIHGDGDVTYHRGHSSDIVTSDGHPVHLSLSFNPSHLEAVFPVVQGVTRAKGERMYNGNFREICPIVVHGDAAISGQGVVYEVANMCELDGYSTGGTIHLVINNQVGFTANYRETRSSLYCTDIAKVTECPVFHVNADDPEAVARVCQMAIRLRQQYQTDVFIDIVGYRRHGHNEGDDPRYTQPLLYKVIDKHPTVLKIYMKRLIEEGVITEEDSKKLSTDFNRLLQESHRKASETEHHVEVNFLGRQWQGVQRATADDFEDSPNTGVSRSLLDRISDAIISVPQGFNIYPKVKRLNKRRREFLDEESVDWALAELMAYGSLLTENVPVRLSGQDSRRGTFAHRHAVLIDCKDETEYIYLNHVQKHQAQLSIYNSHLSEYGVMGFEYGYSLALPSSLVIWEAQFGDFFNGAQIIVDQFISSAESKWQRMSGMVLFLPHGYEGQGPEHSSARVGRFLDLCAEDNIVLVTPTTPANLFHMLRRQMKVPYRKPLVTFTPKSLLRHPRVRSSLDELEKSSFHEIIVDPVKDEKKLKRVILCSGKIYYDLLEKMEGDGIDNVLLVRLEQYYPIPVEQDQQLYETYKHVKDWVWVQEEPVNMGAFTFIQRRFAHVPNLRVISRRESASPANGSLKLHLKVQERILNDAFANL